jgi:hypothetical protein
MGQRSTKCLLVVGKFNGLVRNVGQKKMRVLVLLRGVLLAVVLAVSLLTLSFIATRWGFNVPNVSAVTSAPNLGVYWDAACSESVSSISWGNVSVGSETDVFVYVKNLGSDSLILSMNMSALDPSTAYLKIYLCWDYDGQPLGSGSVVKVTLRLFVTPGIVGVNNFGFNINVGEGLAKSPDINGDGVVNILDVGLLARSWGARVGESNYDYRCDLNNDGIVNIEDVAILAAHWLGSG